MSNLIKLLFISLSMLAGSAQATVVTQLGTTVSFSYDDSLLGLFGTPTVVGDQLSFSPNTWVAKATGSQSFDLKNYTANITITALNSGDSINTIALAEKGDYISKGSTSYVEVGGQIRVTDANAPLNEVKDSITPSAAFTQTASYFPTQNWAATADANVSAFATSSVNVTIENILIALSDKFGDLGFIEKKGVVLNATVAAVPLPQAVWLFGAGLFGLLSVSKRKKWSIG
ncbi:MAG: hypothetical protein ABL925_07885 [Methylococcales bacterium]